MNLALPPDPASFRAQSLTAVAESQAARFATERSSITEEEVAYGRAVRVEGRSADFADVVVWALSHPTHDPAFVAWLGDPGDGKAARDLVRRIRPGAFSLALASVIDAVRGDVARDGGVVAHTVLFGDATVQTLTFDDAMPPHIEVEAIRAARAERRAKAVVRVGMLALRPTADAEPVVCAFVHGESETRAKSFLLPVRDGGRRVFESDPVRSAARRFFVPADPEVVRHLSSSRTS